jgi:hypothetical protein
MNVLGNVIESAIRGGAIKSAVKETAKAAVKGIKRSGGVVKKAIKSSAIPVVRGIKGGSATTKALPAAISRSAELASLVVKKPQIFGGSRTAGAKMVLKQISNDLAKASKGALNKDAAARLARRLTRGLKGIKDKATRSKTTQILKDLLKQARKNETWSQLAKRKGKDFGGTVKNVVNSFVKEGAENIAVDKSISAVAKVLAGIGAGTATGVSTGLIINEKNKKK